MRYATDAEWREYQDAVDCDNADKTQPFKSWTDLQILWYATHPDPDEDGDIGDEETDNGEA